MRPSRESIRINRYAYFVSTQTEGRKPFFRHERWARLMIATLEHYDGTECKLHAYVVMPDHLHLLITPFESVEKSVQLIKGGFSYRAKRELEWKGEIWQTGFTDHRIRDVEDWQKHLAYIQNNPVNAHLVNEAALYEFLGMPSIAFPQGLKPTTFVPLTHGLKPLPFRPAPTTSNKESREMVRDNNEGLKEVVQKHATQK